MPAQRRHPANPVDPETASPLDAAVSQRDRDTLAMVRRALDRKDALLAFQPVMPAKGGARPAFYEGLIRVLDETGRIIPARDFMGAVETSEIGRIIDCLSLEMGLEALSRDPGLRIAVNMSARSIAYPPWRRTLRRGLRGRPLNAERLILEISEDSAMVMPDTVMLFMKEMQAQGISFALDDFGAGLTSFRYLKQFCFDFIKIDGQFIRGIADNADNQCVTAALIAIARQFDMYAVAESVENARDAAMLASLGVDCMQGYYFGAPTVTPPWKVPAAKKTA
jgi:EAL domain-containing protein (putative c-di-GMP-specific phosphodiesterase class I)